MIPSTTKEKEVDKMAHIEIWCKDCDTKVDEYDDERYEDDRKFEISGPCNNCRVKY